MNGPSDLGNSMLKMMTGFISSIKQGPDQNNHLQESINTRGKILNSVKNTIRKDADSGSSQQVDVTNQKRDSQKQYNDKDKMTISVRREGNKNSIIVTLESQDQEDALQIQIDEIRVKAENNNYYWEILDIKQELGQGTFGQVFACLDQKTGKNFALKFIEYEQESDQDPDFKSAVKEIVIMQTLVKSANPSILLIHDVYPCIKDDKKFLVIVMELCECNLMELIKVRMEENKSKWSDDELANILYQLIDALIVMKLNHITHRDIKPQNILYSSADKKYKIADFGGAKFLTPVTKKPEQILKSLKIQKIISDEALVTVRGSPAYWSPEIFYYCDLQKDKEGRFFVGKPNLPYDPYISDMYSLGITLLLMKKLQPRIDREQIKVEVENFKKQKNPSIFEKVLVQMLEINERQRITFEALYVILKQNRQTFKEPNEDIFVNCLKGGKDKKNMSPLDLMQREINLADAYEKLFMLTHAKTHYEIALKHSNKLPKESQKADILNSLGTINCDIDNLDEAEKNYTESLKLYKKLHGNKHTSVADAYNNIGIVLRKKGDNKNAIIQYKKAYDIKESAFGENNLGGALILSNIGLAYRKIGDLDQSIKYYNSAIQIKKLICGDRSLILCGTYDNLARVYFLRQQYDLAISCYSITADIYRKYLTQNWLRLSDTLFELGLCYQNLGRYPDACRSFEEAYKIRGDHNGQNLKSTIICLEHLAQCLLEEKKFSQAVEKYEQLKHIYNKGLIKCPMDERIDCIIDILKNLGAGYMGTEDYKKSLENYHEAIQQLQKRQNDKKVLENSRQSKILYNMGLVYRKMGNIDKAKQFYDHAAATIKTCQAQADLILFGDILNNQGVLYGLCEQYQQGKGYFEQALEKYQQAFGKDHQLCKQVEVNLLELEKWMREAKPDEQ